MRYTTAVLVLVLTLACAPVRTGDGWSAHAPAGEGCPTVTVQNQGFERIVVYYDPLTRRLGEVEGFSERTFEVCQAMNRPGAFSLRGLGRRMVPVFNPGPDVRAGDELTILVPFDQRNPRVIGSGYGAGEDLDLELRGMQWVTPLHLHAGIWADVARCSGLSAREFDEVAWAIADSIVERSTGRLMYGASIFEHWDVPVVVIERPYWLHPTVISHEVLHMLGALETDAVLLRCVMYVPGELAGRETR